MFCMFPIPHAQEFTLTYICFVCSPYHMRRIFIKQLYSNIWIRHSVFAVRVRLSCHIKKMDATRDLYSLTLNGMLMLLFHLGFSLVMTTEAFCRFVLISLLLLLHIHGPYVFKVFTFLWFLRWFWYSLSVFFEVDHQYLGIFCVSFHSIRSWNCLFSCSYVLGSASDPAIRSVTPAVRRLHTGRSLIDVNVL